MKGLFVKDFYLMMRNKKFLFIIAIVAVVLLVNQKEEGISFVIGYVMVLCQELVLNTFSIDEYDQSITFLMALPVSRRTYATEKYVFSFGCGIVGWSLITLICIAAWPSQAIDTLGIAAAVFILLTVFQSIVLPIQIRFGGEKGRVILLSGIIFGAVLISVLETMFGISERLLAVGSQVKMEPVALVFLGIFLCVACLGISLIVSLRMMEKKEF